jgi:hypothetical protein
MEGKIYPIVVHELLELDLRDTPFPFTQLTSYNCSPSRPEHERSTEGLFVASFLFFYLSQGISLTRRRQGGKRKAYGPPTLPEDNDSGRDSYEYYGSVEYRMTDVLFLLFSRSRKGSGTKLTDAKVLSNWEKIIPFLDVWTSQLPIRQ